MLLAASLLYRGSGAVGMFGGGGGAGCRTARSAATVMGTLVRQFSGKCRRNLKKIDPKIPKEQAVAISGELYQIIKEHGPLTVANTWNYAKETGVTGLNSKTHMKLLLKWMRGREMLKLFCSHTGSSKKFLHSTLPEVPAEKTQPVSDIQKPSGKTIYQT